MSTPSGFQYADDRRKRFSGWLETRQSHRDHLRSIRLQPIGPSFSLALRLWRCLPHIGSWVGHEPVAVRHLDQRQGFRVHDVLLADDAIDVEEVGGHRVRLVGREGAGVVEQAAPGGCSSRAWWRIARSCPSS